MGSLNAKNLKLYSLRERRGWSQIEAAKNINIPLTVYQRIEEGKKSGKVEQWCLIQEAYDIPDEEMWSIVKESRRY